LQYKKELYLYILLSFCCEEKTSVKVTKSTFLLHLTKIDQHL